MFTDIDKKYIEKKGINISTLESQIQSFKNGFPPALLERPAIAGDGILQLKDDGLQNYADYYQEATVDKQIIKFVPASGAATRMFKDLFNWQDRIRNGADLKSLFRSNPEAKVFFEKMKEFAFWEDLKMIMFKDCLDADHLLDDGNYLPVLDYLLSYGGLHYSSLPKGLLKFHNYGNESRTAMEEHLSEGAAYAAQNDGKVKIHFTVSPEHLEKFKEVYKRVADKYENEYKVKYELSFSVQKSSTDTIAVDLNNDPLRIKGGELVFRPGGHGALIENLNDLEADIIFIKNIDNVVPDRLKDTTIFYKKVIGGVLLQMQQRIHDWLTMLEVGPLGQEAYMQAVEFAINDLNADKQIFPAETEYGSKILKGFLNRPVRVCGMVKNEGEPGGGPFWVKDPESGHLSLQIVESSQVNMNDRGQAAILKQSTHFNPVDLVCATKDFKGLKFSLPAFVDQQTGFISRKSINGMPLKALELPGLWNGAMAHWITIFVEVPLATFNPVKTINDLLRPEHR